MIYPILIKENYFKWKTVLSGGVFFPFPKNSLLREENNASLLNMLSEKTTYIRAKSAPFRCGEYVVFGAQSVGDVGMLYPQDCLNIPVSSPVVLAH